MYEIVGIRHASYTAKNTGELREGYEVSVVYDYPEGLGLGKACESVWCRKEIYDANKSKIAVGRKTVPMYNRRGILTGWMECG